MSKEAAPFAHEYIVREDIGARLDSREAFDEHGQYSMGELEEMGSRELLDGYSE